MSEEVPEVALLGTAEDSSEATVWHAILQGEGIPCIVRDTNFLRILQEPLPFVVGTIDIYVPARELERARDLLGITERRKPHIREPKAETQMISWVLLFGIAASFAVGIGVMLGLR